MHHVQQILQCFVLVNKQMLPNQLNQNKFYLICSVEFLQQRFPKHLLDFFMEIIYSGIRDTNSLRCL
jgi:hypothetical protein